MGNRVDGDYTSYNDYQIFEVEPGKRYRFRSYDTSMFSCQMQLSVDEHVMTLLSTDGYPVHPYEVDSVYMDSGDRWDFVINANKEVGNYWLKVEVCEIELEHFFEFNDRGMLG